MPLASVSKDLNAQAIPPQPEQAWPEDRRTVEVGTLTAQQIQAERGRPCRGINFDPTVLRTGMRTSDGRFPAARSSAYAKSCDPRSAPRWRVSPVEGGSTQRVVDRSGS
jgi:hypothetical protein